MQPKAGNETRRSFGRGKTSQSAPISCRQQAPETMKIRNADPSVSNIVGPAGACAQADMPGW